MVRAGLRPGRQHDRATAAQPPTTGFTCTYDAWNRLVLVVDAASGAVVAQYQYDARGFRAVSQSFVSGILAESPRLLLFGRLAGPRGTCRGSSRRSAIRLGSALHRHLVLRDRDTTGDGTLDERLFALQDPNWNVTALSDPTGAGVERYGYSAYGQPAFLDGSYSAITSSAYDVDTLYCGYGWDEIVGSYSVRNRVLWPHLGRWGRRDPIGFAGNDSDLYRYCGNGPVDRVDPTGLVDWSKWPSWLPRTTTPETIDQMMKTETRACRLNQLKTAKKILREAKRLGGKGPGIRMPMSLLALEVYADLARVLTWMNGGESYDSEEDVPPGTVYTNIWTGRQYIKQPDGRSAEYY